MKVYQ